MRWLLKRLLVLGVVAGVVAAVAVPAATYFGKRTAPVFLTAAVSRGRVETFVDSTGTVKPVRSVTVGAFISGPVADVFVDFNSVVRKGDLLARIDTRLVSANVDRDRATLATQRAELARVDAMLQQAKNNEARARRLLAVNKDYMSDVDLDKYHFDRVSQEAQRDLARASITQAEATLKTSEANLGYAELRSPVDGIVIERKVDPGQTVAASFQTPEMFIVAPEMEKAMYVFASVDEADIGLIRTAQEQKRAVTFTVDAYPGDVFTGRIHQVRKNGTANNNVVTYPVIVEAANPALKLMPGMTANLSFQVEARDNVLRVPQAAARFVPTAAQARPEDRAALPAPPTPTADGAPRTPPATEKAARLKERQKRKVWVQDGEFLRAVDVTLGLSDGQSAELVEGDVAEGQQLVTGVQGRAAAGRP